MYNPILLLLLLLLLLSLLVGGWVLWMGIVLYHKTAYNIM